MLELMWRGWLDLTGGHTQPDLKHDARKVDERPMTKLSRYSIALALAVIFASLAACGSGSDKEETGKATVPASESMSSQEAVKADVAAKSSASELVAELEVCFGDQQTYKGSEPDHHPR